MTSAAAESAHHHPKRAFARRPTRSATRIGLGQLTALPDARACSVEDLADEGVAQVDGALAQTVVGGGRARQRGNASARVIAVAGNVHVGPWSFRLKGFRRHVGDLASYSDLWEAEELRPTRTLVLTTFASTFCLVSLPLALDIHEQADEIKQRFMTEEPPIADRIAAELEALEEPEPRA
jgi:hypothetical protein